MEKLEPETEDQDPKVASKVVNLEPEKLVSLPDPLSDVSGNILDLEKDGFFKIVKGDYSRTTAGDEEALVWTVEVVKPITCRHAQLRLRHLGDVRFYWVGEKWRKQLYSTELYYSSWVASGAVHHEILDPYEQFQIWLALDARQVGLLKHDRASRVVFKELKQ